MDTEKIDAPVSRRARDGSVEWRCKTCLQFRRPEDFKRKDGKRGYVCQPCAKVELAGTTSTADTVLHFLSKAPWAPVQRPVWEKAVWPGIRLHKREVDSKSDMLKRVRGGSPLAMRKYQRGLMRVLSAPEGLTPQDYFWLVLRPSLVPVQLARSLAVGATTYAVHLSGLEHPRVDEVLFDIRHIAHAQEGSAYDARKAVFEISESLDDGEYHPPAQFKAVQALVALCFPSSEEALIGTVNWAVEAYLAKLDLLEKRPNQLVEREEAIDSMLRDLRSLFRPLAKDWSEAQDEVERKHVNRFLNSDISEEDDDDDDLELDD